MRILVLLAALTLQTQGATLYTSRSTFLANAGNTSTIDFEGVVPAWQSQYYGSTGYTNGGLTVYAPGQLYLNGPDALVGDSNLGTGAYMVGDYTTFGYPGSTMFFLPSNTAAFGLDFRSYNQQWWDPVANRSGSFSFILYFEDSSAETYGNLAPGSQSGFAGFISARPITAVSVMGNGDCTGCDSYAQFLHFDNVTTAASSASSPVPEPGSTLLCASGLLLAGATRRLFRRKGGEMKFPI